MCSPLIKGYTQSYTEYEVKAAYIFNFARFVKWPDSSFDSKTSPFILGIYNPDPFGVIINNTIKNRTVNDRKWIIKHFSKPEDITKCHLLFIPEVDKSELIKILNQSKNKSIYKKIC